MPEQKHTYSTMPHPAEKARRGEIILRSGWQRVAFIAGLGGALIVALIFGFVR